MIKKYRYAKKVVMKPNYYPRYKRRHLMNTIHTLSEEKENLNVICSITFEDENKTSSLT